MLCRKPFIRGNIPFGCGQCQPCRINRRRQWAWRQYLESLTHDHSCFVTLTYDDEHLPAGEGLVPRDLQLWLKKIRFELAPVRVRFFAVGEYGQGGKRRFNPHYHISLFGVPWSALSVSWRYQFDPRACVLTSWPYGRSFLSEFNELTAQYVAGYVVKKWTRKDDLVLEGRMPEFARMSRRPGIGTDAMEVVAGTLGRSGTIDQIAGGDVPRELKIGRRSIPLGRFLLSKLRAAVGFTDEYIQQVKEQGSYVRSLEMSALLEAAINATPLAPVSTSTAFLDSIHQKLLQVEAREKLWRKHETL